MPVYQQVIGALNEDRCLSFVVAKQVWYRTAIDDFALMISSSLPGGVGCLTCAVTQLFLYRNMTGSSFSEESAGNQSTLS